MSLELWGGVECTLNRVQDSYLNQLIKTGHIDRIDDLDKIASLGIKKLRYPVLWEMCDDDFSWAEERLNRLRDLGIEPIVELLHHGSGPEYTNLTDDAFPEHFARYASRVAKKFPWLRMYIPINEPLTTARFGGLYGLWHPHGKDNETFGICLLNQLKATTLAMQAIREVTPEAELLQTEDIGKTFATPSLQYQADFENERRWLTYDLINATFDPSPAMYGYLDAIGFNQNHLKFFETRYTENIILGIDSYITSTRFLDDRVHLYSRDMHGGNGRDVYVDVEAIRVMHQCLPTPFDFLMEAWERYHLPLALTEVHLNSTEYDKISWFLHFWDEAQRALKSGIDVRAVTSWSLLGAYDWDKLVCGIEGCYESGAFRIENGQLQENELADILRRLSSKKPIPTHIKNHQGWWHKSDRFTFEPFREECLQT